MTSESPEAPTTNTIDRPHPPLIAGVALASLLVAWLLYWVVGPDAPQLAVATGGDTELTSTVELMLSNRLEGHDALSVAVVTDAGVRFAHFGTQTNGSPVDETTSFEIGSITKPLTGMLLADLIETGDLNPDTTLSEAVGAGLVLDGSGADVSLEALASHRAGYPRLPRSFLPRSFLTAFTGGDPYAGDSDTVLQQAADIDPDGSDYSYSNLGVAALGNAVAVNQNTDYGDLLRDRLLGPVGMNDTVAVDAEQRLPGSRADGSTAAGRETDEWLANGWQPAGIATWSTSADLARLAVAVFDGSAPGIAALEPRFQRGDEQQIGYGWLIGTTDDGVEITAHSGGTGGFRSWIGLDRSEQRAVVVLSNTTMPVGDLGESLLLERVEPLQAERPAPLGWALVAMLIAGTAWPLFATIRAGRNEDGDRHDLVRNLANSVGTVVVASALIPWHLIPDGVWILSVALTLATTFAVIRTWSAKPATKPERPTLRWISTATTLIITTAAIWLVA